MRLDILEHREEILQWISEKKSKVFIAAQLQCKPETLNRYLDKMRITYDGNASGQGYPKNHEDVYMPLEEYLRNSTNIQTNKIRIKLLKEGYKEHKCERCGLTTWLDNPVPLELHHIDGNKDNNTIENFQLLCPNCHAFTDSYRGKNSTKIRSTI